MTCPHEQVGTFRIQDTGEVVMWACVECRQKFVPLDVAMEHDAKRYRALKTRHGYSMVTRLIGCDGFSSSTKDALIDAYADKAAAEIEDHDSAIRE